MSIFFQGKDDPISHLSRPRLWSLEPAKVLRCGWDQLDGSAKAPQGSAKHGYTRQGFIDMYDM